LGQQQKEFEIEILFFAAFFQNIFLIEIRKPKHQKSQEYQF